MGLRVRSRSSRAARGLHPEDRTLVGAEQLIDASFGEVGVDHRRPVRASFNIEGFRVGLFELSELVVVALHGRFAVWQQLVALTTHVEEEVPRSSHVLVGVQAKATRAECRVGALEVDVRVPRRELRHHDLGVGGCAVGLLLEGPFEECVELAELLPGRGTREDPGVLAELVERRYGTR